MIKYLGSKRTLLPQIVGLVQRFPEVRRVADLFSGTSRVGHALKRAGYAVVANDHNAYAHVLAQCYVATDLGDVAAVPKILAELDALPGEPGYFTETFCERSRFFQPHNGARVDAIRAAIDTLSLSPAERAVVLTSLMQAADRVDSTCGVQMAFVKKWAARSHKRLTLRMPEVLPRADHGAGEARCEDANEIAAALDVDLVYLDPPYNQHSYLGNYHVWETLVRWDAPEVYGVACKRVDCQTRKSPYNSKRNHARAFEELVQAIRAPLIIVSFNDEGYQARADLEALLREHGEVAVLSHDFKRYVGAQIGIYNPAGEKVGKVGKLRNRELLYVLATDAATPSMRETVRALGAPEQLALFG